MYLSLSHKGVELVEVPSIKLPKSLHDYAPRAISLLYHEGDMDERELFAHVLAQGGPQNRPLLSREINKLIRKGLVDRSQELEDPPYQFQPQGSEEIYRSTKDLEDPMGEGLPEKHYPSPWYGISHRN